MPEIPTLPDSLDSLTVMPTVVIPNFVCGTTARTAPDENVRLEPVVVVDAGDALILELPGSELQ